MTPCYIKYFFNMDINMDNKTVQMCLSYKF